MCYNSLERKKSFEFKMEYQTYYPDKVLLNKIQRIGGMQSSIIDSSRANNSQFIVVQV